MAVESSRVTADVVEANEFPDLSNRFQVSGVPKIVINDTIELLGAQREPRFLEAVVRAAGQGVGGQGSGVSEDRDGPSP